MILSVNNIYKSYGKEKVINGVSFSIKEPQIVALVGPNGSGKTTLLNIISNLLPADKGEVTIFNKSNKFPEIFKVISFMKDNSVLYDYLTGYDHLQFIGDMQGISKQNILNTARKIGMESYIHKKVKNYSLGMKQHLLITMSILNQPKLLILDEPLNGLDPTSAIRFRELILELNSTGTTILLSSHNLSEIDRITSHILFLKDGTLIEEDISLHETTYYLLKVNNVEKALQVLLGLDVHVEVKNDMLSLYNKSISMPTIFKTLEHHNIQVQDIEKRVIGSEDRYKKIFVEKMGESQ